MTEGYIKLYRTLLENPIRKKSDYLNLWVTLLLKTNHKDVKKIWNGQAMVIKAGQFITGRKSLSAETGITESKVYRILNYLENEHQIKQQKNNAFTIISILNWQKYQGNGTTNEQPIEQPVNNGRTTSEQPVNTNKNDKNDKNKELSTFGIDVCLQTSTPSATENLDPFKKTEKPKPKKKSDDRNKRITFNRTPDIKDAKFIGITEGDIDVWVEAYPAVNFTVEVKKAIAWIYGAGAQGYKSKWYSFLNGWFNRTQNSGGTK